MPRGRSERAGQARRRAELRSSYATSLRNSLNSAQSGKTWETTPDGREGFQTGVRKVHDEMLRAFIDAWLADGVTPITLNRPLEVARSIPNRAARAYRDVDGFPWLETTPPLITVLPESLRLPHPINWHEQDRILRRLPDHLARMALFVVNTGLRDANLCGLQWS